MLLPALAAREVGTLRGPRLESKAVGDPGLALRLCDVADLNLEDRGGVGALAWNGPTADTLAVGHADGRLVLWQPEADTRSEIDTGHTGPMHGLSFLPDGTVLSAAGDGQVRMHSLRRGATRPFHLHSAAATCVLAVEAASFLSGSSDGTVRLTDTRVPPQPLREPDSPARGSCLVVDQRDQRLGRSRRSVAVASLAQDECRPWLLLTGGSDPAIRLYDMRMARPPAATAAPWVAAYVPSHLKAGLLGSARSAQRSPAGGSVTAVAFARGGADVLGAYAGDAAYGFHGAAHARDLASLLSIADLTLPARGAARRGAGPSRRQSTGSLADEASPATPGGGGSPPAGPPSRAALRGSPSFAESLPGPGPGEAAGRAAWPRTSTGRAPPRPQEAEGTWSSAPGAAQDGSGSDAEAGGGPAAQRRSRRLARAVFAEGAGRLGGAVLDPAPRESPPIQLDSTLSVLGTRPDDLLGGDVSEVGPAHARAVVGPSHGGADAAPGRGREASVDAGGGDGRARSHVASAGVSAQTASVAPRRAALEAPSVAFAPPDEASPAGGAAPAAAAGRGGHAARRAAAEVSTAAARPHSPPAGERGEEQAQHRYATRAAVPAWDVSSAAPRAGSAAHPLASAALSDRGPSRVGDHVPGSTGGAAQGDADAARVRVGESAHGGPGAALGPAGAAARTPPEGRGLPAVPRTLAARQQPTASPGPREDSSRLGAIVFGSHHMGEASDQEVSPRRMYSRSYDLLGGSGLPEGSGMQHMSLSALCQLGGDTLICPSSLGAAFVWEYASGRLTNVLLQGEDSSMESGTARPGYPQLATGSQDSTVRLWSPEAAHQRDLHSATKQLGLRLAAAAENAADAEGVPNPEAGEQAQSLLLAALGLTHRDGELQGRDGRTVRCNVM
uniref:Uncharacterized protein n=1 Tax=Auxenochlorella protothecoides TaxID=3075 RepID=A0A1D2AEQ4_AUXPR